MDAAGERQVINTRRTVDVEAIRRDVRRRVPIGSREYEQNGLTAEMFQRYVRLKKIQERLGDGQLDGALRWRASAVTA